VDERLGRNRVRRSPSLSVGALASVE